MMQQAAAKKIREYKLKNPKDLLLSIQSIVKNRNGAVLARQLILKSDHFDTGKLFHVKAKDSNQNWILVFMGHQTLEWLT